MCCLLCDFICHSCSVVHRTNVDDILCMQLSSSRASHPPPLFLLVLACCVCVFSFCFCLLFGCLVCFPSPGWLALFFLCFALLFFACFVFLFVCFPEAAWWGRCMRTCDLVESASSTQGRSPFLAIVQIGVVCQFVLCVPFCLSAPVLLSFLEDETNQLFVKRQAACFIGWPLTYT